MFTIHRSLALFAASAVATAGLAVAVAPAASAAAALPTGCSADYQLSAEKQILGVADATHPGQSVQLDVSGDCSGVTVINQITVTPSKTSGVGPNDLTLQANAGSGMENITLQSSGTDFTGIWGPPTGFPLAAASQVLNDTQFTAPAGQYAVSIQLAVVNSSGGYEPTGISEQLNTYTLIAKPVVTTADKDLPIGGSANPVTSTVSGTAENPQSTYTYSFNGTLPGGVTFAGGTFKADATAHPGDQVTGTITAKDTLGQTGTSQPFALSITPAAAPTLTGDTDMWGVAGKPFTNTSVKATGGVPPYTFDWDIDPADAKDLGLSMNATTGAITGTIGNYMLDEPVQIGVRDAAEGTDVYTATLHVLGFDVSGSSVKDNIITCQVGKPFAVTFTSGGLGGHAGAYSASTSLTGSGITLSKDGKLTGTPTSCEFLNAAYTLTDTVNGRAYTQTFTGEGLTPVVQTPPANHKLANTGLTQAPSLAALALACLALGLGGYVISRRLRHSS